MLWSIRTTATKPTRSDVAAWVLAFDEAQQDAMRGMDLVLGEERRREAALRAARYQQALR